MIAASRLYFAVGVGVGWKIVEKLPELGGGNHVGRAILKATVEMPSAERRMEIREFRMQLHLHLQHTKSSLDPTSSVANFHPKKKKKNDAHLHYLCCSAHLISSNRDQREIKALKGEFQLHTIFHLKLQSSAKQNPTQGFIF